MSGKALKKYWPVGVAVLLLVAILTAGVTAHDYVPGEPQQQPILLRGGDLYTVADGVMEKTDLLFENGRIAAIGAGLVPTPETKVIDVTGKHVYPGLIAPNTSLGLTEIGEVRATNDVSERGLDNGEIKAWMGYNPDSEIIPTVRSNGITTALIVPGGRLITGRSALLNLDSWTWEDAAVKLDVAVHIRWPRASIVSAWWMDDSPAEQKQKQAEERRQLRDVFDRARAYYQAREADATIPVDLRWDGLEGLFSGTMPLFVHADDYRQIEQAVAFCREYGLKMVLVGGREAYRAASLLRDFDVPVILGRTHNLPMREDDDYDLGYKIPSLLHEAGVTFSFSYGSATGVRNLPFQAGQAVAFGLPPDVALRSLTLTTAEILGIDDRLGSIEIGKNATLVVSEGDIMDPLTHRVVMEFIDGREVNLENKQMELYEKYRQRQVPGR